MTLPGKKGQEKATGETGAQNEISQVIADLAVHLQLFSDCQSNQGRVEACTEYLKSVEQLAYAANVNGLRILGRQAEAMKEFLEELVERPNLVTDSVFRTLSLANEILKTILNRPELFQGPLKDANAVVLDAEMVSSTATCNALRKADLNPRAFGRPQEALNFLAAQPVDLVVIDIASPTGFECYNKLRELPGHRETPVIFVTGPSGVAPTDIFCANNETQFLAKPLSMIHYFELALKSLSRVLKHRASQQAVKSGDTKPAVTPAVVSATLAEDFSQLQASHVSLRQAHEHLQKELGQAQETLKQYQGERSQLQGALDEIKNVKQKLEKQLADSANSAPGTSSDSGNNAALQSSMDTLRQRNEELERLLRENQAAHEAELAEAQRQVRDGASSRARATSDIEQARSERRRIEQRAGALSTQLQVLHEQLRQQIETESASQHRLTEMEQEVRQKDEAVSRLNAELEKERSEREQAEEQLQTTGELTVHLRNCLSAFEVAKQSFKRTQEEMESRLNSNLNAMNEAETRAQKESSDRRRVEEDLGAAQRSLKEQSQRTSMEISRLQSALEFEQAERKRLEGSAIQSRYASLDSARVGRTMLNRFRSQMREKVEALMQSTRRLLEKQLEEDSKKLVESVLESALMLQSSLQDAGTLAAAPTKAEAEEARPAGEGTDKRIAA